MPTPNVELLTKTLAHIKANPEEWNQYVYRQVTPCGTAMCFAGWAAELHGDAEWVGFGGVLKAVPEDYAHYVWGDWKIDAGDRAERILGLTERQAADLFHMDNGLGYIETVVAELCTGVRLHRGPRTEAAEVDHVEPKPIGR